MSISDVINKFLYGTAGQKIAGIKDNPLDEKQIIIDENAAAITYLCDWHANWLATDTDDMLVNFWELEIPDYEADYDKKIETLGIRLIHKVDIDKSAVYINDWILTQKALLTMFYEKARLRGFELTDEIISEYPPLGKMFEVYSISPETAISEAHNTIDSLLKKYSY